MLIFSTFFYLKRRTEDDSPAVNIDRQDPGFSLERQSYKIGVDVFSFSRFRPGKNSDQIFLLQEADSLLDSGDIDRIIFVPIDRDGQRESDDQRHERSGQPVEFLGCLADIEKFFPAEPVYGQPEGKVYPDPPRIQLAVVARYHQHLYLCLRDIFQTLDDHQQFTWLKKQPCDVIQHGLASFVFSILYYKPQAFGLKIVFQTTIYFLTHFLKFVKQMWTFLKKLSTRHPFYPLFITFFQK